MPRLTRLRLGALEDLAQQLRFAPKKRIIAQLRSAAQLAGEIDPEGAYPEDWVVFRITGYRPGMDAPALLVGEALRGELSAFVERVSDRAGLTRDDLPPSLSLDELKERWGVSAKTIERARRRGLIAQRCKDARGVVRLAFPLTSVERFERDNPDAVEQAGAFARIDPSDAARLAAIGHRAQRRFGWSLNQAAERLAARTGRGRETMRQLLQRAQSGRTPAGALPPRQRRVIERAARRAVPVSVIAERFNRTPEAIRLVINQRRLSRLRHWGLPHNTRTDDAAIGAILDKPSLRELSPVVAPATIGGFLEAADNAGKPDAASEKQLATAHRLLLARAGSIAHTMARSSPRATLLDRAEADLRSAARLRAALVASELALVRDTIESRLRAPIAALAPAHANAAHDAAIDACIEAASSFDPARGGRLAASVGLAINRRLAAVERTIRDHPDPRGGPGETPLARIADWTRRVAPWQPWLDLPPGFLGLLGTLPEPDAAALALLHGCNGKPPMTPSEIAEELGVSRNAIVRRLGAGLRALRAGVRDAAQQP